MRPGRCVQSLPAWFAVLLTAIFGSLGHAADVLDEIQVTASRRPLSISETPAALSVVRGASLQSESLATDALAFQPGAFLQQTTPGQGSVIVRGLKGSAVLHLVDGMRVNNAIFRSAPTQYLALVSPVSIDRIEILRGSATSLYGNDAMGGVINVLSRMPVVGASSAGLRGDVSILADTAELTRTLRGTVETGNEHLAALASVDYLESGNRRTGAGRRIAPSGYRSYAGRLALMIENSDAEKWLLDIQTMKQPNTPRVDELVAGFDQDEPASAEFSFAPNMRTFFHLGHDREVGSVAWEFDASWQRVDDDRVNRDFASDERRREKNRSDLIGVSVNGSRESGATAWSFGAEYYRDRVSSSRTQENLSSGITQAVASRFPDDSRVNQGAVYVHALRSISERQTLQAGLRYSHFDIRLANTATAPGANLDFGEISGDAGWLYHLSDNFSLVANIGRGVRAPNIFDLGTLGERPGNRFSIANSSLRSESVDQFDIGVKGYSTNWQFETSIFRLNYRDRITGVLTGDSTPDGRDIVQNRNVAKANIWGVEVGGRLSLSDRSGLAMALNYTRGEEVQLGSDFVPADRIPPLTGRVLYHFQPTDALLVETYLEFAAEQARLSPRDERDSRIDSSGTPGWTTGNVRIAFEQSDFWQVGVAIENVFDKRYRIHGSGIDAVGRNLQASLRINW